MSKSRNIKGLSMLEWFPVTFELKEAFTSYMIKEYLGVDIDHIIYTQVLFDMKKFFTINRIFCETKLHNINILLDWGMGVYCPREVGVPRTNI